MSAPISDAPTELFASLPVALARLGVPKLRRLADDLDIHFETDETGELADALAEALSQHDPKGLVGALEGADVTTLLSAMGAQIARGPRGRARLRRLITLHHLVFARHETTTEEFDRFAALIRESKPGDNLLAQLLHHEEISTRQFMVFDGRHWNPHEPLLRFVREHFAALAERSTPESLGSALRAQRSMWLLLRFANNAKARLMVATLLDAELATLALRVLFAAPQGPPLPFSQRSAERIARRWLELLTHVEKHSPDERLDIDESRAELMLWCHSEGLLEEPRAAWSEWLRLQIEAGASWLAHLGMDELVQAVLSDADAEAVRTRSIQELAVLGGRVGNALRPVIAANVPQVVRQLEGDWLTTTPDRRFEEQRSSRNLAEHLLDLGVAELNRHLCPLLMLDAALLTKEPHRDDAMRRARAGLDTGAEALATGVEAIVHHIAAWQPATRYAPRPRTADGAELFLLHAAAKTPEAWALLLPGLLTHDGLEELVTLVSLRACVAAPELRQTVERCVAGAPLLSSLRARAILDLLDGSERPSATLRPDLASRIAADVDRDGLFPRPLAVVSSTWLADLELEDWLRKHVSDGARAFFIDQGQQLGKQEEALVENLIKTLRDELATRPAPWRPEPGARPSLSLHVRTHTKKEEKKSNLDVALLVTVEIEGRFELKSAVAIQVKKPALEATSDRWDLDVPQLKKLMDHFPCAVYLLLCSSGPPLVVPSKHLRGLVRGTSREDQESARVDYGDIRSAAIPLSQLIVDLALGLWIGRSDENALRIANGTHEHLRPEIMVTIDLKWNRQRDVHQ